MMSTRECNKPGARMPQGYLPDEQSDKPQCRQHPTYDDLYEPLERPQDRLHRWVEEEMCSC